MISQPSNPSGPPAAAPRRAGYVTLIGQPNAGKSTLLNRLVGEHLSIVTPKAQTTWQRVTGILTEGDAQLIFLDTPGLLEARDLLQKSMLGAALEALAEADVLLLVVDAAHGSAARDGGRIATTIRESRAPLHIALNKVDQAEPAQLAAWRAWAAHAFPSARVHDISALEGAGVDRLLDGVREDLPESPFLYPEDDIASGPVRFFVAELVRESVFELYHQEIPYATFCRVGEFREAQDPVYIQIDVYVERASQKGILIGKGGEAIRELGRVSRLKIEHFLARSVYLDLWVKPLKAWRKSRMHLGELGFHVPEDEGR